jgi:hypothetical protein
MSVIVKLLSKFDDSGLKKAKSGFGGLKKTIGAIGIGIGLKALTDGLLDAAKAAAADEKSTRLLNIQLARNAGATDASLKENNKFIESLSLQTGIMDDDLRPTMARFGNITGNVKEAQKLLKISLDGSAGSGKKLDAVSKAVGKAYAGNTTSLKKLFPELSKSKDVLGDFAKTYKGLAEENADPFMKFNNSMDILKEKVGVLVLPLITGLIEEISKPGGLIESVGKFFDDVANPKTDIGQAFAAFGDTVEIAGENLKAFFGLMDPKGEGNAMSGFASSLEWVAITLQTITDGLLVFAGAWDQVTKGNFGEANALMSSRTDIGAMAIRNRLTVADQIALINKTTKEKGSGMFITDSQGGMAGTQDKVIFGSPNAKLPKNPLVLGKNAQPVVNNITINAPNVDGKVVVDSLGKYLKTNGSLPYNFYTKKVG